MPIVRDERLTEDCPAVDPHGKTWGEYSVAMIEAKNKCTDEKRALRKNGAVGQKSPEVIGAS